MPRIKDETTADIKIAQYFGTTTQSLYNWKTSNRFELRERYDALRKYFEEINAPRREAQN